MHSSRTTSNRAEFNSKFMYRIKSTRRSNCACVCVFMRFVCVCVFVAAVSSVRFDRVSIILLQFQACLRNTSWNLRLRCYLMNSRVSFVLDDILECTQRVALRPPKCSITLTKNVCSHWDDNGSRLDPNQAHFLRVTQRKLRTQLNN